MRFFLFSCCFCTSHASITYAARLSSHTLRAHGVPVFGAAGSPAAAALVSLSVILSAWFRCRWPPAPAKPPPLRPCSVPFIPLLFSRPFIPCGFPGSSSCGNSPFPFTAKRYFHLQNSKAACTCQTVQAAYYKSLYILISPYTFSNL